MWAAALRRLALLLLAAAGGAAALGLVIGGLGSMALQRGLAIGFYLVGASLLTIGFLVASRGPVRLHGREQSASPLGARGVRWATRQEQDEKLNLSALLVAIGLALVLIGAGVDTAHRLA